MKLLAIAMVMSLIAVACVEDSADETTTTEAEAVETTEGSTDTTEGSTDTTEGSTDTTGPAMDAPTEIVIGNPIALSGASNAGAALSQIPSYDLWVADVNADGGIYVAEYDQKIPVRIERVDDTSDVGTAVGLVQEMVADEDIHFIFPPWGTASNFAIASVITEAQTPVMGCTVGSADLVENADDYEYFYTMLNQAKEQGTALVELLIELGIEDVAIIHHDDLHGIEFNEVVKPQLEDAGIEIVYEEIYPLGTEDFSQILRSVQDEEPDGLLAFSYPAETFAIVGGLRGIDYNPDFLFATVGVAFPVINVIHEGATEGIFGTGVWNPTVDTEGSQGYFDRHVEMFDAEPDRWASAACYSTGQVLQQAIEAAGTLDPVAVKEAMDTTEFNTILGTFTFDNQVNPVYPGQIGQWQSGEFEVVSPIANQTADPIYPKPDWPAG